MGGYKIVFVSAASATMITAQLYLPWAGAAQAA